MRNKTAVIAALLAIMIALPAIPRGTKRHAGGQPVFAAGLEDIREAYGDIRKNLQGIGRFFQNLSSLSRAISAVFPPGALVLLLAASFLSAGLSSIGVPRGKTSFFVSLALADTIWYLWEKSMTPETHAFLLTIVRINLYVLVPYILVAVLARAVPPLSGRLFASLGGILRHSGRKTFETEELGFLLEKLQDTNLKIQKMLAIEISNCKNDRIKISGVARRHVADLESIVGRLRG